MSVEAKEIRSSIENAKGAAKEIVDLMKKIKEEDPKIARIRIGFKKYPDCSWEIYVEF